MSENDIKKDKSGPKIGKQPSPKYEKGIGLHGPSNCVSKSPSTIKSFIDNMFLGDKVIKVQYGNSGMGRIIDMDGMNSTLGESSKEEFLSFSVEWKAYGQVNINQKMRKDKISSLAIKCYGMKHRSSKFKVSWIPAAPETEEYPPNQKKAKANNPGSKQLPRNMAFTESNLFSCIH